MRGSVWTLYADVSLQIVLLFFVTATLDRPRKHEEPNQSSSTTRRTTSEAHRRPRRVGPGVDAVSHPDLTLYLDPLGQVHWGQADAPVEDDLQRRLQATLLSGRPRPIDIDIVPTGTVSVSDALRLIDAVKEAAPAAHVSLTSEAGGK